MTQYEFAAELLKKYEGHDKNWRAGWDVNAWRIGYGSDTITFDDGTYRKVKQTDVTNEKNATKDLVRRVKEFETKVKKKVGAEFWEPLDYQVKGALISLAYNYGNITKQAIIDAIKTGNSKKIAEALIKSTYNDNKKLSENVRNALRKRRKKEADIIAARPNAKKSAGTGGLLKLILIPLILYGAYTYLKK